METAVLPRFAESDYSVFVSYAGDDMTLYGAWPTDFATELRMQLAAELKPHLHKLRGKKLPEPHDFEIHGIAGGRLSQELESRIASSFTMVIIVGRGYLNSEWCEAELKYFRDRFRDAGIAKRLFVVALDKPTMETLRCREHWKSAVPEDQAWVGFFDEKAGNTKTAWLPVKRPKDDVADTDFLKKFAPLREALIATIVDDLDRPETKIASVDVLIGACTPELEEAAKEFADEIRKRGCTAAVVRERSDWKAQIKSAGTLVLPFNRSWPIGGQQGSGGHIAQQEQYWADFDKDPGRVFGLDCSHVPSQEAQPNEFLQFIENWQRPKLVRDALLDVIFPPQCLDNAKKPPPKRCRAQVFIESNKVEPRQWVLLGEQLRTRWESLLKDQQLDVSDFPLVPRSFDVDRLDSYPLDDVDAVILLWSNRDRSSVLGYEQKVDNGMPRDAPVFVAYICPPNTWSNDATTGTTWEVFRFSKEPDDADKVNVVRPDPDEEDHLTRFLKGVFKSASQRLHPQTA